LVDAGLLCCASFPDLSFCLLGVIMRESSLVFFCGLALLVGFMGLAFVGVASWFHVAGVVLAGLIMGWGISLTRAD
jgi:hypothetical protein